jgi:hypothetical protein
LQSDIRPKRTFTRKTARRSEGSYVRESTGLAIRNLQISFLNEPVDVELLFRVAEYYRVSFCAPS